MQVACNHTGENEKEKGRLIRKMKRTTSRIMALALAFLLAVAPFAVMPVAAQETDDEQSVVAASAETVIEGVDANLLVRRWDGDPANSAGLARVPTPTNWPWEDATFTPQGFNVTLEPNEWLGFYALVTDSNLPRVGLKVGV